MTMSKIFELIEENAGKFVLLAGAIIAILIYLMGVSTNLDYTYSTLITISATLFGFFITALSILLLVFDDNNVKNKPLLRVIQSAKSFPMLYDYMFYAIYSFGATISVFLIRVNVLEFLVSIRLSIKASRTTETNHMLFHISKASSP